MAGDGVCLPVSALLIGSASRSIELMEVSVTRLLGKLKPANDDAGEFDVTMLSYFIGDYSYYEASGAF